MKQILIMLALMALSSAVYASDATDELKEAALAIRTMTASHQLPSSKLADASCVTVIPSMAKAAVIVGGKHGNGVVSCRTANHWSAPAFVTITGGSVGLQAGLEHEDLVLLMNHKGEEELSQGHWNLGAQASVSGAATPHRGGPESRGWKTPVLAYRSSSGAYAGAELQGSEIGMDNKTMSAIYGANVSLRKILDGKVTPPGSAEPFLAALRQAGKK